jgi:hypothetical protein
MVWFKSLVRDITAPQANANENRSPVEKRRAPVRAAITPDFFPDSGLPCRAAPIRLVCSPDFFTRKSPAGIQTLV